MTVQAGEDIAASLALGIGTPEIIEVGIVAGSSLSMLLCGPIESVKVPAEFDTVYRI
jgi:putative effector of murein hydrolase